MNKIRTYIAFLLTTISACLLAQDDDFVLIRYSSFIVENGNIDVRWAPHSDPSTDYYQVFYHYPAVGANDDGWLEVVSGLRISASADLHLELDPSSLASVDFSSTAIIFAVVAYNAAGEQLTKYSEGDDDDGVIIHVYDSTIFLQASYDSCAAALKLDWNRYNYRQWPQPGTSAYEVYLSVDNGANYELNATLNNNTISHTIHNLPENSDYRIYVAALSANNPGDVVNSNTVEINTNMAILPRYLTADYATFSNENALIVCSVDPLSETNTYNLLRSAALYGAYDTIHTFTTTNKELSYTDTEDYLSGPFYYKLEVINYCGINIRESENTASTIVLNQSGEILAPALTWNSYEWWAEGISHYSIERKLGNIDFIEIATTQSTSYTDSELATLVENNYAAEVCYRITAYQNNGNFTSQSNTLCYDLPPNIRFEYDAFMPESGSGNNTFGPTIDFLPTTYKFVILDRSGRKVYETTNAEDTRWDGYINGNLAPEGAYMCIVQYQINGNKKQTIHGAVVVVH